MYAFKFQAATKEKALYRVGQKVTCDYYLERTFKVERKEYELNGTLIYTLRDTDFDPQVVRFVGGLRQKYLNKA